MFKEVKMRKAILGLFIILFCFTIGISQDQKKPLTKEQTAVMERVIENLSKQMNLSMELKNLKKEYQEIKIQDNEMLDWDFFIEETNRRLELNLIKVSPTKKDDFSFLDKYYPKKKIDEFPWIPPLLGISTPTKEPDEIYLKRIEEQNDRLENSASEIGRIKDEIQRQMNQLEFQRIDFKYDMLMLDSMQRSRMSDYYYWSLFPDNPYNPYRYLYPTQSNRIDTNLLYLLCTPTGTTKTDWTKYNWLYLLLNKR
jgi:HAMP domain-containing protein